MIIGNNTTLLHFSKLRPNYTKDTTQLLAQALVISNLDYCNPLLERLPASMTELLQHIQNPALRLVFSPPKFSHVIPLLRDLHWIPVVAHNRFKTMVLAFKVVMHLYVLILSTYVLMLPVYCNLSVNTKRVFC